jgi:hypothetical protein
MLRTHLSYKGRSMKRVLVMDITPEHTDEEVLAVALVAAREDKSSLFGWTITPNPDDATHAVVTMHTD